jgi:hypothetical protein
MGTPTIPMRPVDIVSLFDRRGDAHVDEEQTRPCRAEAPPHRETESSRRMARALKQTLTALPPPRRPPPSVEARSVIVDDPPKAGGDGALSKTMAAEIVTTTAPPEPAVVVPPSSREDLPPISTELRRRRRSETVRIAFTPAGTTIHPLHVPHVPQEIAIPSPWARHDAVPQTTIRRRASTERVLPWLLAALALAGAVAMLVAMVARVS